MLTQIPCYVFPGCFGSVSSRFRFQLGRYPGGDRKSVLKALQAGSKVFLDSVAGRSEVQLNFKPAPEKWSIAEVAEHIEEVKASPGFPRQWSVSFSS
jgi:hypothetical protein